MNGKVARIEDMLASGWDVEDITSDHGTIEVLLRRRSSRTTVVLDRHDAEEIVLGSAPARPSFGERATLVVER